MGLLSFLSRRIEKHVVEGREIIILFLAKLNKEERAAFRGTILLACASAPVARYFPKLAFHLESESKYPFAKAWVKKEEFLQSQAIVHINASKQLTVGTIVHELTHLWQELTAGAMRKEMQANRNVLQALIRRMKSIGFGESEIAELRFFLSSLFQGMFTEGLATYCERLIEGKVQFSDEELAAGYAETKEYAEKILAVIPESYKKGDLRKRILLHELLEAMTSRGMYSLGYHLVYTVLFIEHETTVEALGKMRPFEFIKKYESCILSKGLQPLVSATSGSGILDYKRLVAEWAAAAQEKGMKLRS